MNYGARIPIRIFEYMANGIPFVASDLATTSEFTSDRGVAELVAAGDPVADAGALHGLLDDERQASMSARAAPGARGIHLAARVRQAPGPLPVAGRPAVSRGLVSVITPVRDEAALLRETAATILGQDWPSVEILFVDGGSRDGSRELLEELARRDDRVRVLENPAGDLGSALAIGLAAARGEFVAKLDAHTFFPPGYLRIGVERLRRGDVEWVSGPRCR